jgi:hypothetical protein
MDDTIEYGIPYDRQDQAKQNTARSSLSPMLDTNNK